MMSIELFEAATFDFEVVENIPVTVEEPDWLDAISLVTPSRDAGIYALTFSLQFSIDNVNQDFLYRFSNDGGNTWGTIYEKRVKGRGNIEVIEVLDILSQTAVGNIDVRCQVSKSGAATCEIIKGIIACERKA